jgi:hypothetical protein
VRRTVLAVASCCLGLFFCVGLAIAADHPRITKAVLGTGVTDQYEIVNPANEFPPDTPKIYCAWRAEGVAGATPFRGVFIAEDVGSVAPPNYKIDEATVSLTGDGSGSFSLSKPDKNFPVGKYRLEIYIGGDLAKTVPFTIKAK